MSRKNKTQTTKQPSANGARAVEFTCHAPDAQEVLLAGDFTQWDSHAVRLNRDDGGIWRARIKLAPGRHEYKFIVDGQWRDDPRAGGRVANCFGSTNCVVEVA
jgi:1,4-alpha-glucan branching enzyme